eukprot:499599_1
MSLNRFQYLSTPTADPTPQPTVAPSAQTMAPSRTPTIKPTMIPTLVPSNAPSWSPSPAPSNAPSNAPTNNPIASDDFDYLLEITYVLKAVDSDDKKKIANDPFNVTNDIQNIIKNEYVADDPISHEEFLIDIQRIQGTKIKNIDSRFALIKWTNIQSLELQTRIECTDYACASIKEQSKDENDFAESVTATLQTYFNNSDLQFEVEGDADELEIVAKYAPAEAEPDDYMLYGIGSVCGLLGLIGVLALLFNKGYIPQFSGSSIVDNAQFAAVFVFSLQFWDFYSDVNLSVEIWNHPQLNDNVLLLVSAIGSAAFVIVPYIANLAVAAKIKHLIRNNQAAKSYFNNNTTIFAILVVITGGCYPALALVSSGVFGLEKLTSGLTRHELKRMSKIKVIGTVLLENVPQL